MTQQRCSLLCVFVLLLGLSGCCGSGEQVFEQEPRCGDGICGGDEDDLSCPSDCMPGGDECTADGDCPSGEGCLGGFCRPVCADDIDCPGAQVCRNGTCRNEATSCTSDADCAANESCNLISGFCVRDAGPCLPDQEEPNEDLLGARLIGEGDKPGLRICEQDEDWFRFPASAGDLVVVSMIHDSAFGALQLDLVDLNGTPVTSNVMPEPGVTQAIYPVEEDLDLFVRVYGTDDTTTNAYRLDISLGGACLDELEPNDDIPGATLVDIGNVFDAVVCDDNLDLYSIVTVDDGAMISASWRTLSEATVDVAILANDGLTVLATGSGSGGPNTISAVGGEAGLHYIRVTTAEELAASYTLEVNTNEDRPVNCVDELEENDSAQQATPLEPDTTLSGLTVCLDNDPEDWFSLDLSEPGPVEIAVTFRHAFGDIDIELYEDDGVTLIGTARSQTDDEVLQAFVPADSALLRIVATVQDNAYSLVWNPLAVPACEDTNEPNDEIADATPSARNVMGVACTGDIDLYAVDVGVVPAVISAIATFNTFFGDVDVAILASDGATVLASATDDGPGAATSAIANQTGVHYISVSLGSGTTTSYRLNAEATPLVACQDRYDDNETLQTAPLVLPGDYVGLTLCSNDDERDVFAVYREAGEALDVAITFQHSDGNLDLTLLDAAADVLGSSTSATDDESVSLTAPVAGFYFVAVELVGSAPAVVPYDLAIAPPASTPPTCADDAGEEDDTVGQANVVGPGTFEGAICPDDDDVYFVAVAAGQVLSVSLSGVSGDPLTIEILSAAGEVEVTSADRSTDMIAYRAPGTGGYYVRVRGTWATSRYTLSVNVAPDLVNSPCVDGFEPNDARSAPSPLTAGTASNLSVCGSDPEDFYLIDISADQRLVVDATFSHVMGNLDLRLETRDGEPVAESLSSDDDESVTATTSVATSLLLVVYDADGSASMSDYELEVTATDEACADDAGEPDGGFINPPQLTLGNESGVVCPGDDDVRRVSLSVGERLTVSASDTSPVVGALSVRLVAPDRSTVLAEVVGDEMPEIVWDADTAGQHYVVLSARPHRTVSWDLTASVE